MAELPNRDQLEADFAKKFGRVARRHMHELRGYLGNPPSVDNVPAEFWERVQHETEQAVYDQIYAIGLASAHLHGWDTPDEDSGIPLSNSETKAWGDVFRKPVKLASDAALAAYGWAKERSKQFAEYWTTSTRDKLREKLDTVAERPAESTIEQARQASEIIKPEPSGPSEADPLGAVGIPTADQVDDILDGLFGPTRIVTNVMDETTRTRHAMSESAIEATVGLGDGDIWRINPTSNVCHICMEQDGKRRDEWPAKYAEGPPIHPRCACNIIYENFDLLPVTPATPAKPTIEEKYGLSKLTEAERMELWLEKVGSQKSLRKMSGDEN